MSHRLKIIYYPTEMRTTNTEYLLRYLDLFSTHTSSIDQYSNVKHTRSQVLRLQQESLSKPTRTIASGDLHLLLEGANNGQPYSLHEKRLGSE